MGDEMMAEEESQDTQTQQQTQSTQQAGSQDVAMDGHLWGYLQPCSATINRIDFWRINPTYRIGRGSENEIILPGFKVSNKHLSITWDGTDETASCVVVRDLSSNGTFINGQKIGKGNSRILREGNELALGTCIPQPGSPDEDYRFIYRHSANGPPTTGLYAFYDISTELGKGSFATVMKGICRKTGLWYAVKMIHESRNVRNNGTEANHKSRTVAYAREIAIMEKLKHPNICGLKEVFFQPNGDINLVLELVQGGDLLDYILKNNGLSEPDAKHITYQMCQALAYIHSQGVTHRDLKPENVLLTADNPPIVKVADFGLAKVVDSLTMLRTMCGTPSYLAPEVVKQQNHEGYDNVVDSWSVGVIVFSMLTNASPFIEDENQRDIRTRIAERVIDWQCLARVGNVSYEAQDFIRCLLDEDPLRRMSLTAACNHPWLLSYIPAHESFGSIEGTSSTSSILANDVSMLSSVPENDQSICESGVSPELGDLHIQEPSQDVASASQDSTAVKVAALPGAFPDGTSNGIKREGSRTAPLQRRSHVLSQAAEGEGVALSEPSWDMIAHAEAQDQQQQESGPSNLSAPNKGHNKRVYSELTPLPEETASDAEMNGVSPMRNRKAPARKRKSSDEDESPQQATVAGKMTRAKGKASPPKAGGGNSGEDDAGPAVRRSSRQPQKIARRS